MRTALLVLVLLTVPLAGCGALSTPDTPEQSPRTDSATDRPDGFSENGSIDTDLLLREHIDRLRTENYTARKRIDVQTEDGTTLVNHSHVSKVGTNRTRAVDTQFNEGQRVDWWFNGSRVASRTQHSNTTEYDTSRTALDEDVFGLLGGDVLRQSLENADDPTITSTDGIIQIRATTTPEDVVFGYRIIGGLNVTNQTLRVSMTEEGRITRYTAEFTGHPADNPDTTVEGTYALRFTAYGSTTVERPNWVQDARNAST